MVLKTECRCIDTSLKSILDTAINNLERDSVGTRSDDYEKIRGDLERHLDALKNMGVPETQLDTMRKSVPRDPILKQFEDLKEWLNECECGTSDTINWTQFPYHEVGYRPPTIRTGTSGEACTLDSNEKQTLDARLTELANKYVFSLRDPVFLVFMKDKYGEKAITAANVRQEAVRKGFISQTEMDEFNRIATELDKGCGRQSGKTRNIHDTRLLKERHEAGLLTEKRETYFGKKR